jgi:HK97 family phage prohead protease
VAPHRRDEDSKEAVTRMTHAFSRAELYAKGAFAGDLEYKFTKFLAPPEVDAKTGIFTGYASKFGNEDLGGDIVARGAFTKSLEQKNARKFKLLYEHDCLSPVGFWKELAEDSQGLIATGKLMVEDLTKAREVHALMREGVLDGLSIGYRVDKASNDRGNPHVRVLEQIDLKEISVVMFPMNTEAVISSVKAGDLPRLTEREFQRLLQRDAQLSRSDAVHVIEHGFKSLLKSKRDAAGEVASKPPDAQLSALADELRRLNEAIR